MRPTPFSTLAILVLSALPIVRADVALASLFTDHAVLQRGKPIPVWGHASPGEEVTVSFREARVSTSANAEGKWRVDLPAQQPGEPAELVVIGGNRIVLQDVVVGDVWLCSGQSNMAFLVEKTDNAAADVATANYPQIRHFKTAFAPKDSPVDQASGAWQTCSPKTVGKFTAVGYFFAREIHEKTGVPIGLIHSSVGGTPVEAWMPAEAFASPALEQMARDEANAKERPGTRAKSLPTVLYNGMIAPLVPYGVRGFLWYQGEANANALNAELASVYAENFAALITSWRQKFDQGDVPFYFVQLPNFKAASAASGTWPTVRDAQRQVLRLPATGMAVTIDVGNPDDIHPKNKQVVGHRLALIALKQTYRQQVEASGPALIDQRVRRNRVYLEFDQTVKLKPDADGVFEIAGRDGKFVPARSSSKKKVVSLVNDTVTKPIFVRYAWSNNPTASLFNEAGLPAAPFHVDLRKGAAHP